MTKGILWVSSRITPTATTLTPQKFRHWYETTHIPEVTALSGVPSATRWEAIEPQPSPTTWSSSAPWLTVYEMPSLEFRESNEFKSLDGQKEPARELLEDVFKQARFDTRFYEEVQDARKKKEGIEEEKKEEEKPSFLLSAAMQPSSPTEHADFDAWYRNEHVDVLSRAPGWLRTRRFVLVSGTSLDGFVRMTPEIPKFLALHEFGGTQLPWKELKESAETEWAKKVLGGLGMEEVGWYGFRRGYDG